MIIQARRDGHDQVDGGPFGVVTAAGVTIEVTQVRWRRIHQLRPATGDVELNKKNQTGAGSV